MDCLCAINQRGGGVIAIDGRAAAGKTTFARLLAAELGAGLVHTDDFFLPGPMRTDARLAQPGGNFHYERFLDEVIPFLVPDADGVYPAFAYGTFDCATMQPGPLRTVVSARWRIVEGVCSQHPLLGDYAHARYFADVDPALQMQRITARNGADAAAVFLRKWIVLEEAYFAWAGLGAGACAGCRCIVREAAGGLGGMT